MKKNNEQAGRFVGNASSKYDVLTRIYNEIDAMCENIADIKENVNIPNNCTRVRMLSICLKQMIVVNKFSLEAILLDEQGLINWLGIPDESFWELTLEDFEDLINYKIGAIINNQDIQLHFDEKDFKYTDVYKPFELNEVANDYLEAVKA